MSSNHITSRRTFFSLRVKLVLAIFAVLLFSNGLNSTLNYLNFEKRLTQTSDSTYQVVLNETDHDIKQAISLGLPLSSISNIQSLLERRLSLVDGISRMQVVNIKGDVLYSAGEATENERLITSDITNTFDVKEGALQLYYSTGYLDSIKHKLLMQQLFDTLMWVLITCFIGYIALYTGLDFLLQKLKGISETLEQPELTDKELIENANQRFFAKKGKNGWQRFRDKYFPLLIIALAIVLTIASNVGSSYQALDKFSTTYETQLEQKSIVIGDTLSSMIQRLLNQGVPLDRLYGLEDEFAEYLNQHKELLSIELQQAETSLYHYPNNFTGNDHSSSINLEIDPDSQTSIKMTTDMNIIPQLIEDSLMDMLTVLIASALVVIEIILFVCNFMIIKPWHQIKQLLTDSKIGASLWLARISAKDELGRVTHSINSIIQRQHSNKELKVKNLQDYRFIRLPLFMLVFAEAASLAFFPNFVASLSRSQDWIPESLVTSLPISLFMFCWAISLPFAGYWSDKVGRRKSLIVGGLITSTGLALTAVCQTLELLLIARAYTAVGYGIVFISAQGYITDTTTTKNRTKGMSTFLSSFFSGSLCGAAIGGILADKLGYSVTFMLASVLALVSVLFVMSFFSRGSSNAQSKPVRLNDFKVLLSNKYFSLITFFSAIPAKVVLTGFLYYICPVYLQYLGESSAVSGRVMMSYGIAIIVISPLSAFLVDRWDNKIKFIVFGGLLSALALVNIVFLPGTMGLLMVVILIGIAHGISVSPQIPLVMDLMANEGIDKGKTIGIFRLTERIGNIAGPMLAGLCLSLFGFQDTIILFGITLLISSTVLVGFYAFFTKKDRQLEVAK
ncbi:MFS transporter [Vibrio europaeus]|uniref:Transporter n=1 Tax=Vibrio europaeus TaxID=300876 RepID=A0A178JFC1_9VIBR|nr:MFS transporter [Vibrio europaeus]MDC5722852.1 MFS transporter [Vibrio europaeus]MDC5726814.1 MFS transporter [Vibrio europaeus]MDC5733140.1 MFS transporter [Vibrio europaeus]MDC5736489.1 MFS transporter [Vibrio europaeus]MDC5740908.1 MFS transporter [Vibrio europaeus]